MSQTGERSDGLLTSGDRELLATLLGQDVFMIYTRGMSAEKKFFDVPDLSFALRKTDDFLVVRPLWKENEYYADYGGLEIKTQNKPEQIEYDHKKPSVGPCSTISLTPGSPIRKISLFTSSIQMSNLLNPEVWKFHSSFLVEHEECFKYLIHYSPSPLCSLRFTFDETEINKTLATTNSSEVLGV